MPALLYEKRGEIAYVTLNRPEVHNAMDSEVMVRLADAWQDFAADDSLRVAIITGAGERVWGAKMSSVSVARAIGHRVLDPSR